MKHAFLILFIATIPAVAGAQTSANPPTTSPSTSKSTPAAPTATPTKPVTAAPSAAASSAVAPWIKLPVGVPRVAHGPVKIPFSLRYEDIKIGTGPEGEAGKLWHIKYTGWRAADGIKFDSWEDHGQPVIGTDGKPELDPDGKPKLGEPQPIAVPQGAGRVIPGFDYGLEGMRVGGKRRIFIPWQMAYGTHAIPDRPGHPGIPAKSDLIFDMELVEVTDSPAPQPPRPRPIQRVPPAGAPQNPGASPQPNAAPAAPATPPVSAPAQPSTPTQPTAPAQPSTPQQPPTPAPPATSAPAQPQPK